MVAATLFGGIGAISKARFIGACRVSSVVEQRFCKPKARGSNPLPGTTFRSRKIAESRINLHFLEHRYITL
jgi:hypothetical protein